MKISRAIRKVKKITKLIPHLVFNNTRGINVFADISEFFVGYKIDVIFDVGANVGQSTKSYIRYFPNSTIYSFEPSSGSFQQLVKNTAHLKNVFNYQIALGKGKGHMSSNDTSTMNQIVEQGDNAPDLDNELINITTFDEFCNSNNISHISYLKIDTEGHDLDVLKGAEGSLNKNNIDIIEVEAGMNSENTRHVPFEDIKLYLESKGYYLFGIYEQTHEWPTNSPILRRSNPVFISKNL
jgi:FkbM family methyltransferase